MATSKALAVLLFLVSAASWSREASSPTACQAAASQPAIANAKAALERAPDDLPTAFKLADAWSDSGCFGEALQVLQSAEALRPGDKELETRLRVARSLVGEEHFFDSIDRADAEARLKRDVFRCTTLSDLDSCNEAVRMKPDDPALLVAHGDALLKAKRPADAISRYRLAAALAPDQPDTAMKIKQASAQLSSTGSSAVGTGLSVTDKSRQAHVTTLSAPTKPRVASALNDPATRRYSNSAPETRSH